MIKEISNLKLELKAIKNNLRLIKKGNEGLKLTLNLAAYKIDDLEQCGRGEKYTNTWYKCI